MSLHPVTSNIDQKSDVLTDLGNAIETKVGKLFPHEFKPVVAADKIKAEKLYIILQRENGKITQFSLSTKDKVCSVRLTEKHMVINDCAFRSGFEAEFGTDVTERERKAILKTVKKITLKYLKASGKLPLGAIVRDRDSILAINMEKVKGEFAIRDYKQTDLYMGNVVAQLLRGRRNMSKKHVLANLGNAIEAKVGIPHEFELVAPAGKIKAQKFHIVLKRENGEITQFSISVRDKVCSVRLVEKIRTVNDCACHQGFEAEFGTDVTKLERKAIREAVKKINLKYEQALKRLPYYEAIANDTISMRKIRAEFVIQGGEESGLKLDLTMAQLTREQQDDWSERRSLRDSLTDSNR